jgi:hypothetical protein
MWHELCSWVDLTVFSGGNDILSGHSVALSETLPEDIMYRRVLSMKSVSCLSVIGVAALLLTAQMTQASIVLTPTSYDMPNGDGQASGGSYNYWDINYSGSGSTTTDGAALNGGLGDLTDGIITTQNWFSVENGAGTGPYVGWRNINPTITFNFAEAVTFDKVRIHVDDSNGVGGVSVPDSVSFILGSTTANYVVTDPSAGDPLWLEFDLSSAKYTSSSLSLTLNRRTEWVFVDEVEFLGTTGVVPEPGTVTLCIVGGVGLLALRRRRKV